MRVWVCGVAALACAIGLSGTAAAAKQKPFHQTAQTCAKYASPAWVQKETGVVGTPQKGPAGQCHFVVTGTRDAFQVGIYAEPSPKKALASLQQGWNVLSVGPDSTTAWVDGLGTKAFTLDGGLSGAYVVRGNEFFDLQWTSPVTLTQAQAITTLRALMARVPK